MLTLQMPLSDFVMIYFVFCTCTLHGHYSYILSINVRVHVVPCPWQSLYRVQIGIAVLSVLPATKFNFKLLSMPGLSHGKRGLKVKARELARLGWWSCRLLNAEIALWPAQIPVKTSQHRSLHGHYRSTNKKVMLHAVVKYISGNGTQNWDFSQMVSHERRH